MENKNIPEIRIKYGWLLDLDFEKLPKDKNFDFKYRTPDQVREIIPLFRQDWAKFDRQILQGMQSILGLEFYKDVIDVYMVGAYYAAISDPMIISAGYKRDYLVDVLTHELIHILLMDNTRNLNLIGVFDRMFPEAIDVKSSNHVIVHAVHKEIYLNVLNSPERLERDLKMSANRPSYKDSWNIVEKRGSSEIIEEFKKIY